MRRACRPYTVDFYNEDHPYPKPGDVVRDVSHTSLVRGYLKVVSVRQVRVRKSRGEIIRFRLMVERLSEHPTTGVAFTVYGYAPKKPTNNPAQDPFSPLLPP